MLLAREDPDLDPVAPGKAGIQVGADADVLLGRDAAGPAVDDEAAPDRGEIAAGDEVVPADLDAGAQGLEDAAAELVAERVVAEEGEMGRAAAGRDAHHDGIGNAANAAFRQLVEVGLAAPSRARVLPSTGRPPTPSMTRRTIFVSVVWLKSLAKSSHSMCDLSSSVSIVVYQIRPSASISSARFDKKRGYGPKGFRVRISFEDANAR